MRLPLLSLFPLLAALLGAAAHAAETNASGPEGYPTAERVAYVQACMRQHPGAAYEMLNKCSCTIDAIARAVTLDDFTTMSTIANAMTIGGERGGSLRDNETLQPQIKRFRELQAQAKRGCFINVDAAAAAR